MHITKLEYDFDYEQLRLDILDLMEEVPVHKFHSQISLKHTGDEKYGDFWYQGCGSLKYKFGEDFIDETGELKPQEYILTQSDFKVLNKELIGTYLKEVCDIIEKDYDIGRIRVMVLPHKKVMSMHTDTGPRIHIPMETNENCLMIIDNICHYMPFGGTYLANTILPHTALNANNNFTRIHLLFDINNEK